MIFSNPCTVNLYTYSGTRVKLLLRVVCIDLWSHREGAPGLSQMYLQCQADQSSYQYVQGYLAHKEMPPALTNSVGPEKACCSGVGVCGPF